MFSCSSPNIIAAIKIKVDDVGKGCGKYGTDEIYKKRLWPEKIRILTDSAMN
jgi:hypothetical protein